MPRSVLVAGLAAIIGSLSCPAAAGMPAGTPVLAKPKPPLEGKKPIAVGTIAGKHGPKVRALIFQRLKDSNAYEVTDAEDLKPGDKKATLSKAAKAMAVKGVLLGRVSDKYDLTLLFYNADGKLVREVTFKGGTPQKLEGAVRNEFNLLAGEALALSTGGKNLAEVKAVDEEVVEEEEEDPGAKEKEKEEEEGEEEAEEEEPKEEEEEDKDKEKEDEEEEKPSKPSKPGKDPVELRAGVRGYNRQFAYTGAVTELYPYKLAFGPALLIGGRIYPAAFFRDDLASYFGLTAHAELGIATTTNYSTNVPNSSGQSVTELQTSAQEWNVGAIVRIPLEAVELGGSIVYGSHTFVLKGDEGGSGLPPLVPDVKYGYIRPGVEIRARFSEVFLEAHVGPRFLLSLHQIDLEGVWFPGATGLGFDAGLIGGYSVLPFLDVVAGFDYLRYNFDFSAIPKNQPTCATPANTGCQKVAKGASDTYISGWIGAMVRFGGSSKK